MGYTKINAQVVDQTIQVTNAPLVTSGGVNDVQVVFTFCSLWDGLELSAVFFNKDTGPIFSVPLDAGGSCVVPYEVLTSAGELYFGALGESEDGTVRTSALVCYTVENGAPVGTAIVVEPSDAVYQQIIAKTVENYLSNTGYGETVLYTEQTLTGEQKAQARKNIGAIDQAIAEQIAADVSRDYLPYAVLYTDQNLTAEEQTQARQNIGAASADILDEFKKPIVKELEYETTANVVISATNGSLLGAGNVNLCVAKAEVEPLKTYTISGSSQYGFAYWAFYDADDVCLVAGDKATAPNVSSVSDVTITAPENAKYLRVSYSTENVIAKIETVSMGLALELDAVLFTEQELKEEQKAQARQNIGAADANAVANHDSAIAELEEFVGVPQNLFDVNTFTTTHPANWGISAANGDVTFTHLTTWTSGNPTAPLPLAPGEYLFSATYEGADAFLWLYKDGAYFKSLTEEDTITIEDGATYTIQLGGWQGAGSVTAKGVSIKENVSSLKSAMDNLEALMGEISSGAVVIEKNYETITSNVVISATDGSLPSPSDNTYRVVKVSVEPLKTYVVSASAKYGFAYWAFYDAQGVLLAASGTSNKAIGTMENVTLTAPANASYILVSYNTESVIAKVQTTEVNNPKKKWKDKKWVCIGDSLTEVNKRSTERYFDYVRGDTCIEVVNMGVSGSGYARRYDDGNAFYQRAENVDTTADVVTIFGSFNDLGTKYPQGSETLMPLGTATDTGTETIGGCINKTIDVLIQKMPTIVLGIVAPTPWDSTKPATSGRDYNYVNLLKEICELRSIPFLDLWRGSNLRPWDADFRALAYSKDGGSGTHPDETGHKIVAPKFKAFLETLIM